MEILEKTKKFRMILSLLKLRNLHEFYLYALKGHLYSQKLIRNKDMSILQPYLELFYEDIKQFVNSQEFALIDF